MEEEPTRIYQQPNLIFETFMTKTEASIGNSLKTTIFSQYKVG